MRILSVIVLAFLMHSVSLAQDEIPTNEETGKAEYQETKEVSGLDKDSLYTRGIEWVKKFYSSPYSVMKTQDKEGGKMVGQARFRLSRVEKKGHVNPNAGFVSYQITMEFKEGRYRYTIDGIRWERTSYYDVSEWSNPDQSDYDAEEFNSYIAQTIKYFDDLTADLEDYMKVGKVVKKDDW